MKKIFIIIIVLIGVYASNAMCDDAPECDESTIQKLTGVVTDDLSDLRDESDKFDIPISGKKKYVVNMREINRAYQEGSLTRTEYVMLKRQLISRLK